MPFFSLFLVCPIFFLTSGSAAAKPKKKEKKDNKPNIVTELKDS